ncbi:MAG: CatB-related O-acetyltransferase [Spirochaetaceae bacterium]|jgi:acetyltransferase-like isoleucine patch superfamily enzyme|nr:CatB-related O-acetyltransferase [Spirochaetaceae bacterium]
MFFKKTPKTENNAEQNDTSDDSRDEIQNRQIAIEEIKYLRNYLRAKHVQFYGELIDTIEFGDFTYGLPFLDYIDYSDIKVKIGRFCSIAKDVVIMMGGEHHSEWLSTYPFSQRLKNFEDLPDGKKVAKGNVTIGNDVWLAGGVKILSGVSIGDGCVVGANSLVTKDLPEYTICGGVPAKVIRKRFSDEITAQLKKLQWWNWREEDLCGAIPILQTNDIEKLIAYSQRNNCICESD